jgi:hypothetical protein
MSYKYEGEDWPDYWELEKEDEDQKRADKEGKTTEDSFFENYKKPPRKKIIIIKHDNTKGK